MSFIADAVDNQVLATLLDRIAIEEVIARMCRACDSGDGTAMADIYTENGTFHREGQPSYTGRAELAALGGSQTRMRHVTTNPVIAIDVDIATHDATLLLFIVDEPSGTVRLISSGTYADTMVRTPKGWRISERQVRLDLPSALGSNAFTKTQP